MAASVEGREVALKTKRICRFCLTQVADKLSSIFSRDSASLKTVVPLPVQIMACASIEVFPNDGMPNWICIDCRALFEHGYRFKQMCKRGETLLRQFPLTGEWPVQLAKPRIPPQLLPKLVKLPAGVKKLPTVAAAAAAAAAIATPQTIPRKTLPANPPIQVEVSQQKVSEQHADSAIATATAPKKILNTNAVSSPEPPVPVRMKKEKLDEETAIFLHKVENDEELSIDDVQRLIAAADDNVEVVNTTPTPKKPKVLNKSSIRILNKEAEIVLEPRYSIPQVQRDEAGNVAVVTEILDPSIPYEPEQDPAKSAVPIPTNVFPCPHCERSFPLRQLREIHMVNHSRERSFQCGDCDKAFFSKYDLQKHSLIHTGAKPFKCTVCDRAFTRGTLLHRHEKTHTDIPKYICIYCEKPFISKDEMEKHTERHLKTRPFICKVCNKSFAFKQGLERHEVVHSIVQPYPCQYCEESFSTPSRLSRHLTAHAGRRPYPCKFCSKAYLLSHHLTRHMRSHKQGTGNFMCNECQKIYKSRDELLYHSAVHATETLCCPLCKDVLEDVDMVSEHIKAHAEGEAYACEFCDLIFMSPTRLQEHTDSSHAEDLAAYQADEKLDEEIAQKALPEQQETKEQSLVELPESGVHFTCDENFKLHATATTRNADQPQILNQVVYKSKILDVGSVLDDNILEHEEAMDQVSDVADKNELAVVPAKMRKVDANTSGASQAATSSRSIKTVPSAQVRRKAATASSTTAQIKVETTSPKSHIEIEDIKLISPPNKSSINKVLNSLPKGLSVRKSGPVSAAATFTATTSAATYVSKNIPFTSIVRGGAGTTKTSPSTEAAATEKRTLRSSPRYSNEGTATTAATESSAQTNVLQKHIGTKRAVGGNSTKPGATTTASGAMVPGNAGEKVVKMMIGDKKVKVHKISITRTEADAMAKDGRIRFKDGNMILTHAQTPKSSK